MTIEEILEELGTVLDGDGLLEDADMITDDLLAGRPSVDPSAAVDTIEDLVHLAYRLHDISRQHFLNIADQYEAQIEDLRSKMYDTEEELLQAEDIISDLEYEIEALQEV